MLRWLRHISVIFALMISAHAAFSAEWHDIMLETPSGKVSIAVEIAKTHEQRQKGLMFREDLIYGQGMLFVFQDEKRRSFWMKNTPMSLDILFYDAQGVYIGGKFATIPYSTRGLSSPGPAQYALELPAGHAKQMGLIPEHKLILPRIF